MPKKKNFLGGMQNYNPNTGEYESRLVKANGEGATKANMPDGEKKLQLNIPSKKPTKKLLDKEVKDMFSSREEGLKYINENFEEGEEKQNALKRLDAVYPEKSFKSFKKDKGNDFDEIIDNLNKEYGLTKEKGFQLAKTTDPAIKGDVVILNPSGVPMTPSEFEYVLENKTLKGFKEKQKQKEQAMRKGMFDTDKPDDDTFERINNARMGAERKKESSPNKYNLKPTNKIRSFKMGSLSQEIDSTYNSLSDFYGVDLVELVYGEGGFMKTQYPNNFPDFRGDVVYSPKYWDEFEKWAKEEKGVDFTDRAWERYKLDPDYFEYKTSRNFVKEIREYGKKVEPNHPILKKERVDYDDDLPF